MEKYNREELEEARKKLAEDFDEIVKSSSTMLESLKELNDNQIAAVATFGFLMRFTTIARRPALKIEESILSHFEKVIDDLCPPLKEISTSRDPCFEASIQYAIALQKCKDENNWNEDQCHDAWGYGAQAVMCTMKELQDMKGWSSDIFGRLEPPKNIQ